MGIGFPGRITHERWCGIGSLGFTTVEYPVPEGCGMLRFLEQFIFQQNYGYYAVDG